VQRNARKQASPELADAALGQDDANALVEQAAMDLFNAPLAMANSHDLVGLRAELVRIRDILTLDL